MLPSSWHALGMVLCCTAATGPGMRSTCSIEPASAARCLVCSTMIIIIQRARCTVCRIAGTLCRPKPWAQRTGLATATRCSVLDMSPSSVRCHADAARTRNRYRQKHRANKVWSLRYLFVARPQRVVVVVGPRVMIIIRGHG